MRANVHPASESKAGANPLSHSPSPRPSGTGCSRLRTAATPSWRITCLALQITPLLTPGLIMA